MRGGIFAVVRPYIAAAAVVATATVLVLTIYITHENLQWMAFLSGILMASVLAETARATRSEWVLMRRTAQLAALKEKFEREIRLRISHEKKFADFQALLQLVDGTLSTMIVLIDTAGHCRYHNRAFRTWLRLKTELIEGRHLRELFGSRAYAEIATAVQQSLDGHPLRYEHLQKISGSVTYRLQVEHVPQFNATGQVTGFYFLAEDITRRDDLPVAEKFASEAGENIGPNKEHHTLSDKTDDRHDEGKLFISAIQNGEFCLYCQLISPLPVDSGKPGHYAIMIRLKEEEESTMPPGTFFPMAEKTGLMPYLDRWVVQQVLLWVSKQQNRDSIFFINVASATLGDPEFPDFVQNTLNEYGVPGFIICFEVYEADLTVQTHRAAEFIRQIRQYGCYAALSGFGRNKTLFEQIRGFQIDFLKIDGGIILNMLNAAEDFATVSSISRTAKKIGIRTIAELVESDEIIAKLAEIGIDYSQGSSISLPRCLTG